MEKPKEKMQNAAEGEGASLPYAAYSLSRKNALTWLAALFALLSLAARIAYYSLAKGSAEGAGTFWFRVLFIALPSLCCFFFAFDLIVKGERRLYQTSRPVLFFVIFLIARVSGLVHSGENGVESVPVALALSLLYIALAVLYRFAVNTGGRRRNISLRKALALAAFSAALVGESLLVLLPMLKRGLAFTSYLAEASLVLSIVSVITALAGAKKTQSVHPLPMAGDRKDGRRIRTLDPMNNIAVYVMNERNTANNLFSGSVEITKTEEYIREKREQGMDNFGYTHIFLAAYARSVASRPAMNRFISGQKVYSREERIEVMMAIKKDMSLEAPETVIDIELSPEDTAQTVYEKFNREVEAVKSSKELDSGFDKFAYLVNYIPGVLLKFTVWLFKLLDYFGLLPNFITKISPFHGSMFLTSMGSLGIPPVFHHLYNFGNIPLFLAFGMKRTENEVQSDGSVSRKKYIDFTFNTDERICDGYYYASSLKLMKRIIADPRQLDEPPRSITWDVE